MDNNIWKAFVESAIEKTAIMGSAIYGGLSLLTLKDKAKEMGARSRIDPIMKNKNTSIKLKSPYAYQFEGGKKIGLNQNVTPNRF